MKKFMLAFAGAVLSVSAFGIGTSVYANGPAEMHATNSFDPGVITNGSTAEEGDTITLAAGTPRNITGLTVYYALNCTATTFTGAETFRIRFYNLDGTAGAPGTIIWDSGQQPVRFGGRHSQWVAVPNITVPDTFAWTIKPENVLQTGTTEALGPVFQGPPTIRSGDTMVWHRLEPAAAWTNDSGGTTPGSYGATMWANGNPPKPYDNTTNGSNFFGPLPWEGGDDVSFEGTARTMTSFQIMYYSDITVPVGNEGVIARIYRRTMDFRGMPQMTPVYTSPETLIDATAAVHTLDFALPNIVANDDMVWTVQFTHVAQIAGNEVGSLFRTPPDAGGSAHPRPR